MLKNILSILLLCSIATAVGYYALEVYMATQDVELSIHGKIAMALGVFFTFAVGFGLMGLIFFSNRGGHDEEVHQFTINKDDSNG